MRLRDMIYKTLIALVLTAVIALAASLILSFIIPSYLDNSYFTSQLLLSFISPISFSVIMIYLLHVYGGNGEEEVCEEYPDKYPGIIRDIPKVVIKERVTLLLIFSLGILNIFIWAINTTVLKSTAVSKIASLFICTSSIARLYPSLLGYLLGTLLCAAIYVTTYALFRFKWRKFM